MLIQQFPGQGFFSVNVCVELPMVWSDARELAQRLTRRLGVMQNLVAAYQVDAVVTETGGGDIAFDE